MVISLNGKKLRNNYITLKYLNYMNKRVYVDLNYFFWYNPIGIINFIYERQRIVWVLRKKLP